MDELKWVVEAFRLLWHGQTFPPTAGLPALTAQSVVEKNQVKPEPGETRPQNQVKTGPENQAPEPGETRPREPGPRAR